MSQLDPDRFILRQADQAREAYAQVMEELELVKEQLTLRSGLLVPRNSPSISVHSFGSQTPWKHQSKSSEQSG
jgi:hypothetical protein